VVANVFARGVLIAPRGSKVYGYSNGKLLDLEPRYGIEPWTFSLTCPAGRLPRPR
jgi:hypothetical protein